MKEKNNSNTLIFYKQTYNSNLKRLAKADLYLETQEPEKCTVKQKFNDRPDEASIIDLYNEIIAELSILGQEIEKHTGHKLTHEIKINGFQEVRQ